jgi:hypothetical protein
MKKRFLTTLAVGIWIVSSSFPANAEQLAPNPNYRTINAHNSSNYVTFDNFGILISDGALANYSGGRLNNFGKMVNIYSGGTLFNFGTLTNYGTLINNFDGFMYNFSRGTLTNNSGGVLNNNSGTLFNFGMLTNDGTLTNNSGGVLNNEGHMGNSGILDNSGKLYNSNNGLITGTGNYTQNAGNTINNGTMAQQAIQILGGQLSGIGTITGNVSIGAGATVKPGDPSGTLTINGNFTSSGNLLFEIFGQDNGQYNQLKIYDGDVLFAGGGMEFNFINDYHAVAGDRWDLLFASSISGLDTLAYTLNGLDYGLGWKLEYNNGIESLVITPSAVPIPGALWLLGSGIAGLAGLRRFRKNA